MCGCSVLDKKKSFMVIHRNLFYMFCFIIKAKVFRSFICFRHSRVICFIDFWTKHIL